MEADAQDEIERSVWGESYRARAKESFGIDGMLRIASFEFVFEKIEILLPPHSFYLHFLNLIFSSPTRLTPPPIATRGSLALASIALCPPRSNIPSFDVIFAASTEIAVAGPSDAASRKVLRCFLGGETSFAQLRLLRFDFLRTPLLTPYAALRETQRPMPDSHEDAHLKRQLPEAFRLFTCHVACASTLALRTSSRSTLGPARRSRRLKTNSSTAK